MMQIFDIIPHIPTGSNKIMNLSLESSIMNRTLTRWREELTGSQQELKRHNQYSQY